MRRAVPAVTQVSGVYVMQSGFFSDFAGVEHSFCTRRSPIRHAIIRVKGRDMPGKIRAYGYEKLGDFTKLLVRIVEIGHDERCSFDKGSGLPHSLDRVEHRLELSSANLPVVFVLKAFQVDIRCDQQAIERLERFLCEKPVRYKNRRDSQPLSFFGTVACQLEEHCRFVVGECHGVTVRPPRLMRQLVGS